MQQEAAADGALDAALRAAEPLLWLNPARAADGLPGSTWGGQSIGLAQVEAAAQRLARWRPVLQALFPELAASGGVIESALQPTPALQRALGFGPEHGRLFVKADHGLPVAGSIKARGGLHEVLEVAESVALRHGLLPAQDPAALNGPAARACFADHEVAVGSTGNLGLSVGVMAAALGLRATVHMSADAKPWKRERLRQRGVVVVEHAGDYASAVAAGRQAAASDPRCHFVDDEGSLSLFAGYAAAALHLRTQLAALGRRVDAAHPLFVYLPCGVGGAPGGIAFGLGLLFGAHVHCFFAEPTHAPCVLVALRDGGAEPPSVYEFGLDNRTEADGLAVPRASARVVAVMRSALAGVFTVDDAMLFRHLRTAALAESMRLEPSAAAGFDGPGWLLRSESGQHYLARHGLAAQLPQATHVVWTTGGLFVPEAEYRQFLERGRVA